MFLRFITSILLFVPVALCAGIEPSSTATDFEWELQTPDRIIYRDRVPVGQIALTTPAFGKKPAKPTGEAVALIVEIAYCPGDSSARYYGLSVELQNNGTQTAATLDATEIPVLYRMMDYTLKTATDIGGTERSDTRFQFRSKAGLFIGFEQHGKTQQIELRIPAHENYPEVSRWIARDQLSTLRDLLDLTVFELKRQGATIIMAGKTK
jgi:hypothetical protein